MEAPETPERLRNWAASTLLLTRLERRNCYQLVAPFRPLDHPLRYGPGVGHNPRMKITHTDTTFTMSCSHWSGTYPLAELPRQLAFYRRMRADFPKSGTAYDVSIDGLEALARELEVQVEPEAAEVAA